MEIRYIDKKNPSTYTDNMIITEYITQVYNDLTLFIHDKPYDKDYFEDNLNIKSDKVLNKYLMAFNIKLNNIILNSPTAKNEIILYRGVNTIFDLSNEFFTFKSITSTSKSIYTAYNFISGIDSIPKKEFRYLFKIIIPHGFCYLNFNSMFNYTIDEEEHILPLFTIFQINDVFKVDNVTVVTMTCVYQPLNLKAQQINRNKQMSNTELIKKYEPFFIYNSYKKVNNDNLIALIKYTNTLDAAKKKFRKKYCIKFPKDININITTAIYLNKNNASQSLLGTSTFKDYLIIKKTIDELKDDVYPENGVKVYVKMDKCYKDVKLMKKHFVKRHSYSLDINELLCKSFNDVSINTRVTNNFYIGELTIKSKYVFFYKHILLFTNYEKLNILFINKYKVKTNCFSKKDIPVYSYEIS